MTAKVHAIAVKVSAPPSFRTRLTSKAAPQTRKIQENAMYKAMASMIAAGLANLASPTIFVRAGTTPRTAGPLPCPELADEAASPMAPGLRSGQHPVY